MDTAHRELLKRKHTTLLRDLIVSPELLGELYSKDIINDNLKQEIEVQNQALLHYHPSPFWDLHPPPFLDQSLTYLLSCLIFIRCNLIFYQLVFEIFLFLFTGNAIMSMYTFIFKIVGNRKSTSCLELDIFVLCLQCN